MQNDTICESECPVILYSICETDYPIILYSICGTERLIVFCSLTGPPDRDAEGKIVSSSYGC